MVCQNPMRPPRTRAFVRLGRERILCEDQFMFHQRSTRQNSPSAENQLSCRQFSPASRITRPHGVRRALALWLALGSCLAAAMGRAQTAPPNSKFLLGADISGLASGRGGGGFGGRRLAEMPRPILPQPTPLPPAPMRWRAGVRRGGRGGYQENGQPGTEISIMMNHHWNAFRLRVFVDPVRNAPNNNLSNTIPLARQIKAAGALFLLDIHYSDTWADPQHQETPLAWQDIDADHTNQSLSLPRRVSRPAE